MPTICHRNYKGNYMCTNQLYSSQSCCLTTPTGAHKQIHLGSCIEFITCQPLFVVKKTETHAELPKYSDCATLMCRASPRRMQFPRQPQSVRRTLWHGAITWTSTGGELWALNQGKPGWNNIWCCLRVPPGPCSVINILTQVPSSM